MNNLQWIDVLILVFYFGFLLGIAWWTTRGRKKDSTNYFLAGRDVGWVAIGASLFASNIGSEHLVGLAGTGAATGLTVGHFELLASLILLLLGWLFVPFYLRTGVVTMPEFLERRYNPASRWYFTTISIIGYVLTKISVTLYAGGIIIRELTGWNIWVSSAAIVIFTGAYTILGGLRAVVYTELVQTFVLLFGTILLVWLGLDAVGGWAQLQAKAPEGFFDIWKPANDSAFPWTGILFGAPLLGIWYWCTDQVIVQRVLSAKSESHARTGTIFASYLKILPMFLFVVPGVIAAVLYQDITPQTADQALPTLVLRLLGPGARGLFFAALLAALMSSLASVFNSSSTLITWDFYRKIHPDAKEKTLVLVGRISTAVLVVLGLLWIPFMKYISSQLYIYLQSIQGYIAPPIAACFLLGLFMPRLNGAGAITSLLSGFVLGALRLGLELANGTDQMGLPSGSLWETIAEVNFLHYAIFLFVACSAILIGVSYLTKAPTKKQLQGLTLHTIDQLDRVVEKGAKKEEISRDKTNIWLSVGVVAAVVIIWFMFS